MEFWLKGASPDNSNLEDSMIGNFIDLRYDEADAAAFEVSLATNLQTFVYFAERQVVQFERKNNTLQKSSGNFRKFSIRERIQ